MTALKGHRSQETAYVVNTANGSTVYYWVETAQHGPQRGRQRMMSRYHVGANGNPAKPITDWVGLCVMCVNDQGRVMARTIDPMSTPNEFLRFRREVGPQLTAAQNYTMKQYESFSNTVHRVVQVQH